MAPNVAWGELSLFGIWDELSLYAIPLTQNTDTVIEIFCEIGDEISKCNNYKRVMTNKKLQSTPGIITTALSRVGLKFGSL